MSKSTTSSGFALLLALWTLAILSVIALTLAASVATDVRASQEAWNGLQAERLAKAGYEVASYLQTRGIVTTAEDLSGLPVQPVIPGLRYKVAFDPGAVDVSYEGENRRFDFSMATEERVARLFGFWTGDAQRGREIAASIADWVDADNDPKLLGAESDWYSGRGYLARNTTLGSADLVLIKGMMPEDFRPSLQARPGGQDIPALKEPIAALVTWLPVGDRVNPNYAPRAVLESIPEIPQSLVESILEIRQGSIFTSPRDFQQRTGVPEDSPVLNQLAFDRGSNPSILSVARIHSSSVVRAERRAQVTIGTSRIVGMIDRSVPGP